MVHAGMPEVSSLITDLQLASIPEGSWNRMLQATLGTTAGFKNVFISSELDKQLDSNILILMRKHAFHLKQQFGLELNFEGGWWGWRKIPNPFSCEFFYLNSSNYIAVPLSSIFLSQRVSLYLSNFILKPPIVLI